MIANDSWFASARLTPESIEPRTDRILQINKPIDDLNIARENRRVKGALNLILHNGENETAFPRQMQRTQSAISISLYRLRFATSPLMASFNFTIRLLKCWHLESAGVCEIEIYLLCTYNMWRVREILGIVPPFDANPLKVSLYFF